MAGERIEKSIGFGAFFDGEITRTIQMYCKTEEYPRLATHVQLNQL